MGNCPAFPSLLKTCPLYLGKCVIRIFLGNKDLKDFYERGACRHLRVGTNTF